MEHAEKLIQVAEQAMRTAQAEGLSNAAAFNRAVAAVTRAHPERNQFHAFHIVWRLRHPTPALSDAPTASLS